MADDDDGEFQEEVQEFKTEIKGFERAGGGIRSDVNLKLVSNPYERFKIIVTAVANKINTSIKSRPLSNDDFYNLQDKIMTMKSVQYKNPSAYVLGYYVTKGGKKDIIEERLIQVESEMLAVVNETSEIVTIIDVIRYAYFWREVLEK